MTQLPKDFDVYATKSVEILQNLYGGKGFNADSWWFIVAKDGNESYFKTKSKYTVVLMKVGDATEMTHEFDVIEKIFNSVELGDVYYYHLGGGEEAYINPDDSSDFFMIRQVSSKVTDYNYALNLLTELGEDQITKDKVDEAIEYAKQLLDISRELLAEIRELGEPNA